MSLLSCVSGCETCLHTVARYMQVTDIGLRWLLALPALAELHVVTSTHELDVDGSDGCYEEIACSWHEDLIDDLGRLQASFKKQGRRLITSGDGYVRDNGVHG